MAARRQREWCCISDPYGCPSWVGQPSGSKKPSPGWDAPTSSAHSNRCLCPPDGFASNLAVMVSFLQVKEGGSWPVPCRRRSTICPILYDDLSSCSHSWFQPFRELMKGPKAGNRQLPSSVTAPRRLSGVSPPILRRVICCTDQEARAASLVGHSRLSKRTWRVPTPNSTSTTGMEPSGR